MNALVIDIRKAEPADAPEIAEVHMSAWLGAYSGIIPHRALSSMVNRRGAAWWERAIRKQRPCWSWKLRVRSQGTRR